MSSKHDKGQWIVKKEHGRTFIVGDRYIAEIFDHSARMPTNSQYAGIEAEIHMEAKANAKLIGAASRLLGFAEVMAHAEWACNCADQHSWYGEGHASECPQGMAQELIKLATE